MQPVAKEPLKCPACRWPNPMVSIPPVLHGLHSLDRFRAEHTIIKNVLCKSCGAPLILVFRLESVEQT